MEPLRFLGIPITPIGYYMECMLTNAQIDLIVSDVSVVDYNYNKEKKKHKKGEFDNTPASNAAIKKANEEWTDKYGNGENAGTGLSISEIFGNGVSANVGVKL